MSIVSRPFFAPAVTLLTAGLALSSCNFREDKVDVDQTPVAITEADLHYDIVNERVFAPYCASCHSPSSGTYVGINLSNFQIVSSQIDSIRDRSIDERSMPPSSSTALPARAYDLLKAWIDAGAPQ